MPEISKEKFCLVVKDIKNNKIDIFLPNSEWGWFISETYALVVETLNPFKKYEYPRGNFSMAVRVDKNWLSEAE